MQILVGTYPNDGSGENDRAVYQKINQYGILNDKTINAAFYKTSSNTNEAAITLAIVAAALLGTGAAVWVPASMLPYNASLVTFNTAVRMTREGGNPEVFDIIAYGGKDGDITVGVTPSFNAATAAAQAYSPQGGGIKGGVVWFPAGQWYFLTTPTTLTGVMNVTYQGEGHDCSALAMGAAGVTIFNLGGGGGVACTRVTIKDLWVGSFTNYATGYGLNATTTGYPLTPTSELLVDNVKFENLPNPIYLDNVAASIFRNCRVQQTRAGAMIGHGVYMIRSVSLLMDNVWVTVSAGTLPGDATRVDSDCDTVLFARCENVTLGNGASTAAFHVMDSIGSHPPRIIRFSDCDGENAQWGWLIDAARDVRLSGCESANHNLHGCLITAGNSVAVVNSQFMLNQQHGIWAQGGAGILIDGNTCSNNSQQTNGTYDGIVVSTAGGCRVVNNRSGDIFFTLANKQRVGLNLVAGSDFLFVGNNDLQLNTGQGFQQSVLQGSTGLNNQFFGSGFFAPSEAAVVAGFDTQAIANVTLEITLTAARVIGALASRFVGQRVVFTFIQSGAGAFAVTWNAIYKVTWSDVGNATPKRTAIAFIYDGTNYNQDGAQAPYV